MWVCNIFSLSVLKSQSLQLSCAILSCVAFVCSLKLSSLVNSFLQRGHGKLKPLSLSTLVGWFVESSFSVARWSGAGRYSIDSLLLSANICKYWDAYQDIDADSIFHFEGDLGISCLDEQICKVAKHGVQVSSCSKQRGLWTVQFCIKGHRINSGLHDIRSLHVGHKDLYLLSQLRLELNINIFIYFQNLD